ncbi:hypothetical protein J6590_027585 [Homalodisca vitripennis]|nr:hypothetical protein J6590_027585 [Homalodisca vitripennis]
MDETIVEVIHNSLIRKCQLRKIVSYRIRVESQTRKTSVIDVVHTLVLIGQAYFVANYGERYKRGGNNAVKEVYKRYEKVSGAVIQMVSGYKPRI